MIITLAITKGGAGRSTLALNLAVTACEAGHRTLLIDADEQGAVSRAFGRRVNFPEKLQHFDCFSTVDVLTLRRTTAEFDTVIIDTPSRHREDLPWQLACQSDCVVMPISPSFPDLEAAVDSAEYLEAIRKIYPKIKLHYLLNQHDPSSHMGETLLKGVSQLCGRIPADSMLTLSRHLDFGDAFMLGLAVSEFSQEPSLTKELTQIYSVVRSTPT